VFLFPAEDVLPADDFYDAGYMEDHSDVPSEGEYVSSFCTRVVN
jgi:hypothetical protein